MATQTQTRVPAPRRPRAGRQSLLWWATTISGALLLVLLGAHMIAHHFVVDSVGGLRSYDQVLDYLANPVMFAIEAAFLVVVTVHAMLGLRSVLFDLTASERHRTWVEWGLRLLGALTLAYGFFLLITLASRA